MRLWWALALLSGCTRAPEPAPARPPRPVLGRLDGEPLYARGDGSVLEVADGGAVMARAASGWEPLAAPGRRIELDDGSYWMSLTLSGERRWVSPAHPKSEIAERKKELAAEAEKLPAAEKARVLAALDLIALVSTLEGRFADPATRSGDRAASLGIFQWATERRGTNSAGSTLARFFARLARRARTKVPLYTEAWTQCEMLGLGFRAGDLTVKKKLPTGAELEQLLGPEMGRGPLRSYQLIAALDWIDDVKQTVVRPGLRGAAELGHDYAEAERGRMVTLKLDHHTLELRPSGSYTVGDFFSAPSALATAVSLGVNRPHFVEAALWLARRPQRADVDALLAQIHGPDAETRWKASDLDAASLPAYAALQELVWPSPAPGADEAALERAFTERALDLYRPEERERRARRLVTGR